MNDSRLTSVFFTRDVLTVAKELLGKILIKETSKGIISGRIVEVEAYNGLTDEAAHTFRGLTPRNQIMFEEGGLLYVYFTYGVHYCSNIVTGKKGEGNAVLIRGIEPIDGIELMANNRFRKTVLSDNEKLNLTNGPAKICQSFGFDRKDNGTSLISSSIYLIDQPTLNSEMIVATTRIGIKKSVHLPWRFYIKNNPYVSKK